MWSIDFTGARVGLGGTYQRRKNRGGRMKILKISTVGSRAHGTARPESDHDRVVVYLQSLVDIAANGLDKPRQKQDDLEDVTYWELGTLIKRVYTGNMTAIEAFFAPADEDSPLYLFDQEEWNYLSNLVARAIPKIRVLHAARGYALSCKSQALAGKNVWKNLSLANIIIDQAILFTISGMFYITGVPGANYAGTEEYLQHRLEGALETLDSIIKSEEEYGVVENTGKDDVTRFLSEMRRGYVG